MLFGTDLQYIKQPKRKPKGKKARNASAPAPAPKQNQKKTEKAPAKKPQSPKKAETDPGSFFAAFGSKGDSDSDSDDDEPQKQTISNTPSGGKHVASAASSKSDGFDLGDGFGGLHDDNDDDLGDGGITANWNISKAATNKSTDTDKQGGDDDEWGAARKHAEALEAREADRKAREDKLKAEAEEMKKQRLADAAAKSDELKAKRLEEEALEQKKKEDEEKKAKEAREEARRKMKEQVESVEQTVDLDAQRDIMKQYEQSFLDKELGSASPSSDFGF